MSLKTAQRMQDVVEVRCAWESACLLGEGPVWDTRGQKLWFVDIEGDELLAFDEKRGGTRQPYASNPTAIVPIEGDPDFLVVGRRGLERLTVSSGVRQMVAPVEPDQPSNRPNDAKCDRTGRLWIGTMDSAERRFAGSLYRLDRGGVFSRMILDIGVSNGLDWSPDGSLFYYTDSMRRTIWRYDFDSASSTLGARSVFATVPDGNGNPDGLTVDSQGCVWSAHWDGGKLTRYDPDGGIDRVIPMPVPRPTSLCFGGPDLGTLYVTSARTGLAPAVLANAPLSGALFGLDVGVDGVPSRPVRFP